ncbi:MAG: endonuclease VIII [Chloroflexi bacterium]|nr:MAG: endonuclease VIII [Chloroflexota bacterium]
MPEGPEIKRAADELAAAIAGRTATEVFFAFDHLKPYQPQLSGQRVQSVEARGKAMLVRFANGLNIYSHNQLYGRWMVRPAYDFPQTNRQLRLAIHNSAHSALLYSASDIAVLADEQLSAHPYLSRLGPNLLDPAVTALQVAARFSAPQFARRRLTSLLLDQQFLAGLGNYLRSEVLFVARVHPALRPADCTPAQISRLAEAALSLTRQSYRTGGITNNLQQVEQLRQAGVSRDRYRFWVFNRADEPCWVCGTPIIKDKAGGRRLYFCPVCQRQN